eukprot:c14474_g1_i1 orf=242-1045(+)
MAARNCLIFVLRQQKWALPRLSVAVQRPVTFCSSIFGAGERDSLVSICKGRRVALAEQEGCLVPTKEFLPSFRVLCCQSGQAMQLPHCFSTVAEKEGVEKPREEEVPVASIVPLSTAAAEQAAGVGYKIIGRVKPDDFGKIKPPKSFAVVQVGSHQFKVSPGDCIYTEKLTHANVNDKLRLENVLLLGSKSKTIVGRPTVPKAYVHAAVEEHALDAKVIIFKKKRRKNYRRTRGHRQELTRLRILEVEGMCKSQCIQLTSLQSCQSE